MTRVDPNSLEALTRAQCASIGLEPASVRSLWLFGSRTTPDATPEADWDVLAVVGSGLVGMRRVRAGALDVVVVSDAPAAAWLRSDLGVHVARYGQRLFGDDTWRPWIDAEQALCAKRTRTTRRMEQLARAWPQLSPSYRDKHGPQLRRDVQRVLSLEQAQTVPPRPWLDAHWSSMSQDRRRAAISKAGAGRGIDPSFLDALSRS